MPAHEDVTRLGPRFEDALQYAARLHARQTRKGASIPYVSHLMSVCALVLEDGGDEDQAIAALLHDAVEDQGGAPVLEEIRRRFGDRVADIVDGCTDADTTPKPPWRERKERYVAHLRHASADVLRVSAADKLHNARSILSDLRRHGDAVWSRFTADRDNVLWYYRSLVSAYEAAGGSALADEVKRVVAEIESLVRAGERPS
jgi:(p)ppGpp synthase/HD superfamily hydrolase